MEKFLHHKDRSKAHSPGSGIPLDGFWYKKLRESGFHGAHALLERKG
jgi:hypothetical protein